MGQHTENFVPDEILHQICQYPQYLQISITPIICLHSDTNSMIAGIATRKFSHKQEQFLLQLFSRLSLSFGITSIEDVLIFNNLEQILLAIDYDYFEKVPVKQSKTPQMVLIVKSYLSKVLHFDLETRIEKQLIAGDAKTWISVVLYLFGNCEHKLVFVPKMIECTTEAQEYFMKLMNEITVPSKRKQSTDLKLSVIEGIQNQLKEKDLEVKEMREQLERLTLQNVSLRTENQRLFQTLTKYLAEKTQLLESVNTSTMQQLIERYQEALDTNEKLSIRLERYQDQNCQLQELYSGVSNDLIIAKRESEQKETALKTRVPSNKKSSIKGMRFSTNSDSDEEISYYESIEMHTEPLRQEIGHLDKYSKSLRTQMSMLYKEFQCFVAQLKPFKDEGMFEDVPRSVF